MRLFCAAAKEATLSLDILKAVPLAESHDEDDSRLTQGQNDWVVSGREDKVVCWAAL